MIKNHQALLLVDTQVNMFAHGSDVFDASAMLKKFKNLLAAARAAAVTVVFLQNGGSEGDPDEPGSVGWYIHPELAPLPGEKIIQKSEMDAFEKTDLEKYLRDRKVEEVIIAGLQSEFCVATNARTAARRGFQVTLLEDAHSTYDSGTEKAVEIIADINAELVRTAQLKRAAQAFHGSSD